MNDTLSVTCHQVAVTAVQQRRCPPSRERVKVLAVLCGNGTVEVYGDDHVDVHVVQRLHVDDEDAVLANLLDQYHEGTMPVAYRRLYWPNKLRAFGRWERVTPEQAIDAPSSIEAVS